MVNTIIYFPSTHPSHQPLPSQPWLSLQPRNTTVEASGGLVAAVEAVANRMGLPNALPQGTEAQKRGGTTRGGHDGGWMAMVGWLMADG